MSRNRERPEGSESHQLETDPVQFLSAKYAFPNAKSSAEPNHDALSSYVVMFSTLANKIEPLLDAGFYVKVRDLKSAVCMLIGIELTNENGRHRRRHSSTARRAETRTRAKCWIKCWFLDATRSRMKMSLCLQAIGRAVENSRRCYVGTS